jgi:hypothetical protein
MYRTWIPLLAMFIFTFSAVGQTTRPAGEPAKENAELKARIAKLESYVAELEAKLDKAKPKFSPRADASPFHVSPPFQFPVPAPAPKAIPSPGLPPQTPKDGQRREFNGQEFFVIPLR